EGIGINAAIFNANPGNITINVAQDVIGKTGGINATTGGNGNVAVAAGNVTTTAGVGIKAINANAVANAGTITVTHAAGKLLTATGGNGIETNSGLSTGAATVNVNGEVKAVGAFAGVKQTSTAGANIVNVAATGKIDPLIGIDQLTASGANVVNNAGLVEGNNIGVQQVATATGTNTIDSNGIINGKAAQGVTQTVVDGTATITGTGIINGGIIGVNVGSTGAGTINISGNSITGGSDGINAIADGTGGIKIDGAGSVTGGTGAGINAVITKAANASDIVVSRTGGDVTGGSNGIVAVTDGTGNVLVTTTGNVAASAGSGIVADQRTAGVSANGIKIETAAGKTITASSVGIAASSVLTGDGDVVITNNSDIKAGILGIAATRFNSTVGGDILVTNTGAIGNRAAAPGTLLDGIQVLMTPGSNGNVVVTNSGNIGSATDVLLRDGISAGNGGTPANTGNVTVNIANASIFATDTGIKAFQNGKGNLDVIGTGTGTISAASGNGIKAQAQNGFASNVGVNVTQNVIGKTNGILATTDGTGNVAVTAGGNVTATGGVGISATNTNAAANTGTIGITVAAGKLVTATGGDGIVTNSGISTGLTTIAANGNVTSTDKTGITANTNGGALTITQAAASTITAAVDAIKVNNGAAGGAINVNTGGTLIANNGSGVDVRSASATADPIIVTTNIVKSTGGGGTWGSQVRTTAGTGDIVINNNGKMGSATGNSTIFGGILATTGGTSNRNITVNVNADIGTATDRSTTTANIAQVQVAGNSTSAKTLAVNVNNASIFATSVGVRVDQAAAGHGDVRIIGTGTGTISANGIGSTGILARNLNAANNGNITVDVTQSVDGKAAGINASTVGGGNISVVARGNVTTTAGSGITATNSNAAANSGTILVGVDTGKLVSATGGNGITTNSGNSTGLTNIIVQGEVKASGAGFAGIKGTSTNGGITVQVATTGKVDPEIGVDLATVNGALSVVNAGLIQGDVTAIKLVATGTGTAAVNNSGTATGGTNAVLGSTNNTAFTIANNATGIMNGAINVTGSALAASQIANAGTWNAAGTSSFNGSWLNSGTTNVANGGAITIAGPSSNSGTIRFAGNGGLTTNLTNSGTLTAQNGTTGGAIVLTGNYVGGGIFAADYNSGTITADTLRITGTATGTTAVLLNRTGVGFMPTGFLPIVTVVPGAAAPTFTSASALPTTGFLIESFGQNLASNTQWGIIQSVNPIAGDLGGVEALGAAVSNMLDEPASSFVTQRRDASAGQTQFGLWIRGGAAQTNQDLTTTLNSGAFSLSADTRYRISHQMLQMGLDYGILNMGGNGWNLHFGLTGGKVDAGAKRRGSATNVKLNGEFLGGYIFLTNDALTLDASVRKEWRDYDFSSPALLGGLGEQSAKGNATVASVLASYRFGKEEGIQITPHVGYSYGDSDIDPFAIDSFTTFDAGSDRTEIGRAGLTLSYRGSTANGNLHFEPFASATALRNWSNRESASVSFVGASTTNFDVGTIAFRNAMRYSLGLKASNGSGKISAFVAGNLTDGNRVDAASLSIGARINF
ncbi:MAG: beta strand repeat-containing protein, partial [Sphingorhabdus sp.]